MSASTAPKPPRNLCKIESSGGHSTSSDNGNNGSIETLVEKAEDPLEAEYPGPLALVMLFAGLCLSVLLVSLDRTIIATAIPRITDEFDSLKDVSWYGSAYLVTSACFQLPAGKLFATVDLKWSYIATIVVFEIGSLICGAAPNSIVLIVGRAVAGIGSSGIASGSMIIVSRSVPLRRRPIYLSIIGAMFGIASVAGPPLGGALTDRATWRWCFYINLPLGAFTIVVLTYLFNPPKPAAATKTSAVATILAIFDLPVILALFPAVISLLIALSWGGLTYPWSDYRIVLMLTVAGVGFVAFAVLQILRPSKALVPARIISQQSVAFACIVAVSVSASFMVVSYYLPFYFQGIKRSGSVQSGYQVIPSLISLVVFSTIGGVGVSTFGYYVPFMLLGSALLVVGTTLMHTLLNADTSTASWIGFQVLVGAGGGFVSQQTTIAVQAVLPQADVPIAMALIVFFQTLGAAVSLAISQAIFDTSMISSMTTVLPEESRSEVLPKILTSVVVDLSSVVPAAILPAALEAYNHAMTMPFVFAAAMGGCAFLASMGMEWVSVKREKRMAPPKAEMQRSSSTIVRN